MPGLAHFCEHLLFMVSLFLMLLARTLIRLFSGYRTISPRKRVFRGAPYLSLVLVDLINRLSVSRQK